MTMWYPWGKCCCEPPPCDCCPGVLCGETLLCDQCMDGDRCPNGQCPQLPNCDCPCRCCFDGYECPECGCPDEARCWDGSCPGEEMTGANPCDCHCPCREIASNAGDCLPVCWDGSPPVQTAQGCACPPVPCDFCIGSTQPDRLYLTIPETVAASENDPYCKCECNYDYNDEADINCIDCTGGDEIAYFDGKCCRDAAGVYVLYNTGRYTRVDRGAKTVDDCQHGATANTYYDRAPNSPCVLSWRHEHPIHAWNLANFCPDGGCRTEECDCGQQPPCFPGCNAQDIVSKWCMANEVSAGITTGRPGFIDPPNTYRWVVYVSGLGVGWSDPLPSILGTPGWQQDCYPHGLQIHFDRAFQNFTPGQCKPPGGALDLVGFLNS